MQRNKRLHVTDTVLKGYIPFDILAAILENGEADVACLIHFSA